jgi:hypothetical protein
MGRFDVVAVTSGEVPPPDEAELVEIMRLSASAPWGPTRSPARARPKIDEAAEAITARAEKQIARFGRHRRWDV